MFKSIVTALILAAGIGLGAAQPASASPQGLAGAMPATPAVSADIVEAGHRRAHRGRHFRGGKRFRGHAYYGGHGYSCGYFLRKAQHTGKRYWWKKYRRCVARGHYYAY